jgi:hypothetical protein
LNRCPQAEKEQVLDYIRKTADGSSSEIRYASDEDFRRAKEKVLAQHAPLLAKLGQSKMTKETAERIFDRYDDLFRRLARH